VRSNSKALQVWAPRSVIGIVWSIVCKDQAGYDKADTDVTLTQLKICKKCAEGCQLICSLYTDVVLSNNLQIGSISATEIVNDILQKHPKTGPEWFSLVRCWWQGPVSGMSLDMTFTTLGQCQILFVPGQHYHSSKNNALSWLLQLVYVCYRCA